MNLLRRRFLYQPLCLGLMLFVPCASLAAVESGNAVPILSLDQVLAAVSDDSAETDGNTGAANPEEAFRERLATFRAETSSLPDSEAARRWVSLLRDYLNLSPMASMMSRMSSSASGRRSLSFDAVLDVIPPPSSWRYIAGCASSDKSAERDGLNAIVRCVGNILTNDRAAAWRHLKTQALPARSSRRMVPDLSSHVIGPLLDAFASGCDDPALLEEVIEARLAISENREDGGMNHYESLTLPDVVTILGMERAERILRRALRLPFPVDIPAGLESRRLAIRLALNQDSPPLRAPQWKLAASPDGFELYEKSAALFPKQESDWNRRQAEGYHVLGLILRDRASEAVDLMKNFRRVEYTFQTALEELNRAGHAPAIRSFLHELLSENPRLDFWDLYARIAVKEGRGDEMIALARTALADSSISSARFAAAGHLLRALLAADRIDDVTDLVTQAARWSLEPRPREEKEMWPSVESDSEEALDGAFIDEFDEEPGAGDDQNDMTQFGVQAIAAGGMLGDSALVENGLLIMSGVLEKAKSVPRNAWTSSGYADFVMALIGQGRFAEAQRLIIVMMRERLQAARTASASPPTYGQKDNDALLLAELYHRAGRWDDLLALFESAPVWTETDASSFIASSAYCSDPTVYLLASALQKAGRRDDALRAAQALLDRKPGFDPAYEILVALDPPDIIARFDALFARDRFEERPLIWKAQALLSRGKLEEAERIAREAVAIDPSDGEQGAGRRMRVYSVLRDIRNARGDSAGAKQYSEIVAAIRIAEEADRFAGAGLIARAIDRYAVSLEHFADAYCIQSRIAVQLAQAGRMREAEDHYRRAFELMPESFGRLESHCFGCESIFEGKVAENMADSVFTRLRREDPSNPRVAYLLGYLREDQGGFADAAAHYRTATALDSDYLNAWKRLAGLRARIHIPSATRNEIALRIARLDPSGKHTGYDAITPDDPAIAWTIADERSKVSTLTTNIFPLKSAPRPGKSGSDDATAREAVVEYSTTWSHSQSSLFRKHPLIRALGSWLDAERTQRRMRSAMTSGGVTLFGGIY